MKDEVKAKAETKPKAVETKKEVKVVTKPTLAEMNKTARAIAKNISKKAVAK